MRILVTAGNTFAPIDRVRGITNIFTGRTGARIAVAAHAAGHQVTLVTSHPEAIPEIATLKYVQRFLAFAELEFTLNELIPRGVFDAVIHAAAVSDYLVDGVFDADRQPLPHGGKVKSDESELWLKLKRAPKLIDRMRTDWKFAGVLVKFKLEVGIDEETLLNVAEESRQHSGADLMVANTLEGADEWAMLGPIGGKYQRLVRAELAERLLGAIAEIRRG